MKPETLTVYGLPKPRREDLTGKWTAKWERDETKAVIRFLPRPTDPPRIAIGRDIPVVEVIVRPGHAHSRKAKETHYFPVIYKILADGTEKKGACHDLGSITQRTVTEADVHNWPFFWFWLRGGCWHCHCETSYPSLMPEPENK